MKKENMKQMARFWNNIADDFDAIYTGNKSTVGQALDKWLRKDIYQRFDWVIEKSGDVRGQQICDIGCGSGRFAAELAKRGAARVTGVDIASEMLKLAAELAEKKGVGQLCEFVHSDLLDWKTDKEFDLTIAIGFWDYIAYPSERLKIIRSITEKKFLSAWPRFWTWRAPIRKVRLQYIKGCPVYFFTKSQVCQMIRDAGFEVQCCDTVGKLFCVEAKPV